MEESYQYKGYTINPGDEVIYITVSYKTFRIRKGVFVGMSPSGLPQVIGEYKQWWPQTHMKKRRVTLQEGVIFPKDVPAFALVGVVK